MQINELNKKYQESLEQNFSNNSSLNETIQSFKDQGLPTTKLEGWKYTSLSKFLPESLSFFDHKNEKSQELISLQSLKNYGTTQLIFLNGQLVSEEKPKNVTVTEEAFKTSFQRGHEDQLENLCMIGNTLGKSYVITVNEDTELDLHFYFDNNQQPQSCYSPRVQINVAASKTVKVFKQFQNLNSSIWLNPTFLVKLEKNTQVEWNLNSLLEDENILTSRLQVEVERDATFRYTQNFKNEKLSRTDFIINLNGENATADLGGFYQLDQEQHHDTALIINHNKSHTYSHQLFKGILDDQSRGVFNGMVFIHPDAQQVDASQLNKNLLLSKKAHVDTRPQLQVHADDVKAAHGATIGQLDPDELFYLMARGIPQEKATTLLLAGYGQQVFEKVSSQNWKEAIEEQNQKRSTNGPS